MRQLGIRTALMLSLFVFLIGIVFFDFKNTFLIILLVNQIAFIVVGLMYDQTKMKAERDHLTKLYNRVFISEKLPKLLKRQTDLSLCIVDIDAFKKINDTYGHLVGDDVIRTVAAILNSETRKTDIVVRWGGDEFLIIAPNLNYEFLIAINERINSKLEERSKQYGFTICISMGIASCSQNKDIEALIQLADENLYRRKHEKQKRLNPQYL